MPESTQPGFREFLASANQALADLEDATGKPVRIVGDPSLNVLATIRRAGPQDGSHVLRLRSGGQGGDASRRGKRSADYLIVFECRMALRDGSGPRTVLRDNASVREQVIRDCGALHPDLPAAKAQDLGSFLYSGLLLQLRSIGPGLLVDRWIRRHCPDLREAQEQAISTEITSNLGALQPSTRANYPPAVYQASIAMNGAYAVFGGDLLGQPHLAVPFLSQGHGPLARRLITLATGCAAGTGADEAGPEPKDREIIDAWAKELGLEGWYEWAELSA